MAKKKKVWDEFKENAKDTLDQGNSNKLVFKSKKGATHMSLSVTIAFILSIFAPYLALIVALAWLLGFFKIEVMRASKVRNKAKSKVKNKPKVKVKKKK